MDWIKKNKAWIFTGIVVPVAIAIIGWLFFSPAAQHISVGEITATNNSTVIVSNNYLTTEVEKLVTQLMEKHAPELTNYREREQANQDQIKALTNTIATLVKQQGQPNAPLGLDEALAQIAAGNTEVAEALFQRILERKSQEGHAANKEAAAAARHLGSLAFLHDTHKALKAYRRATELDPENVEGWKQLGHLLHRIGQLSEAEIAYRKIESLGKAADDQESLAIAYSNLGSVYGTRGEIDKAEAMHNKALALNKALGRKDGMARNYGNLGFVYQSRGELDKAEAMYKKALALFREIGAEPQVKYVQGLLDSLR